MKLICNKKIKAEGHRFEICVRMAMSFIVNSYIRQILLYTAPIMLSITRGNLEFIKDSLAVFFITKLDYLNEPVNFLSDFENKRARIKKEDNFLYKKMGYWFFEPAYDEQQSLTGEEVRALKKMIKERGTTLSNI